MSVTIPKEAAELINDPATIKVLATVDESGAPHLAVKQSLHLDREGRLVYTELLESSRSNRNLVRSIWFGGTVSVLVSGPGGAGWQVKGKPVKTLIAGPVFRNHYQEIRSQLGDVDVAAVWIIEPEEVSDGSFKTRSSEEEARFPYFNHLDRLTRDLQPAA